MTNCHQWTPQSPFLKAGWRLALVILASLLVVLLLVSCDAPAAAWQEISPVLTLSPEQTADGRSPTATITTNATRAASPPTVQTIRTPGAIDLDPTLLPDSGPGTYQRTPTITEPQPTVTPCLVGQCSYPVSLLLSRPIARPANDQVDTSYRFGSTLGGQRDPHHGVEFLNRGGTPVLAAADGIVVVSGNDQEARYGPYLNYYGNLVVIQHELPRQVLQAWPTFPTPVYTVYAHLSQLSVKSGQVVSRGQQIGLVGMTGSALGNHLHFEVRLGENTYQAAHNPELWLAPDLDENVQPKGSIAGRVISSKGRQIAVTEIVIQNLPDGPEGPNGRSVYINSYEESALIGRSPWQESFSAGNLPSGWYRVSFPYFGMQSQLVHLLPGQIVVVVFHLD